MKEKLYESEMWKNKVNEEKDFLWWFRRETGMWWANLRHFYYMFDPIVVQKSHHLLDVKPLLDNYDKLAELSAWSEWHKVHIGGKLIGGPLVRYFLDHMAQHTNCKTSQCEPRKFVQYSGHDSTLMSVYAALGYDELDMFKKMPHFADAIFLELHKDEKENYFVQVLHRDGVTGEVVTIEHTPYSKWKSFANNRTYDSISQWCIACYNIGADKGAAGQCLRLLPNYIDQLRQDVGSESGDEPRELSDEPRRRYQIKNTAKLKKINKKSVASLIPPKILKRTTSKILQRTKSSLNSKPQVHSAPLKSKHTLDSKGI